MNRKLLALPLATAAIGFAGGWGISHTFDIKPEKSAVVAAQTAILTDKVPSTDSDLSQATNGNSVASVDSASLPQDLEALQTMVNERNAKIAELQLKLNPPTHDAVSPEEDTPEYREKLASELIDVTKTKEMIQQAFQSSARMMARDLPAESQEAMSAAMQKHYSWEKMEKMFSKVYTEVFSAQELADMTDFYRSDVGTAMLKKQPEVMQKTMQMVQQINQDLVPKMQAELDAINKKNKDKPRPLSKSGEVSSKN